jgi:hypothetical protein
MGGHLSKKVQMWKLQCASKLAPWSLYILMGSEGAQYAGIFSIYLFAELIG